jgi:hypothetical protein
MQKDTMRPKENDWKWRVVIIVIIQLQLMIIAYCHMTK